MILEINPPWNISSWIWNEIRLKKIFNFGEKKLLKRFDCGKKSTCRLFSCLAFSFSVSCASLVSPICSGARWEIQMYSSRLSTSPVRVCATIQKFLQKSFNAADGKNFFRQEHTFKNLCLQKHHHRIILMWKFLLIIKRASAKCLEDERSTDKDPTTNLGKNHLAKTPPH